MFKGFQNTSRTKGFNGFPALNFQMNNEAYGFSGCTHWWDAAYGLNTQTDLSAVSIWQPKIGNVPLIQNTAGNQPRLVLNDANFNNLSSVQYVDTNRTLGFSTYGIPFDLNTTLFFVGKVDSLATARNTIWGNSANNGMDFCLGGSQNATVGIGMYNSGTGSGIYTTTTETTNSIILIITSSLLYINGIQETTTGSYSNLYQYNRLGGNTGTVSRIAETGFFNYKMNSEQISMLSGRLNSKYAIY